MDEFDKSLLGIHKERIEEIIYRPKTDYDTNTIAEAVLFILEQLDEEREQDAL